MAASVNSYQAEPDPADLGEAARLLRAILEAFPPSTTRDRATARRIEGAAVALDNVAMGSGRDHTAASHRVPRESRS